MAYNGKTNWQLNEIVKPEDMNRIEQGVIDAHENLLTHKTDTNSHTDIRNKFNEFVKGVTGSNATLTITKGNGTTSLVTVNNVANATNATNATKANKLSYESGSNYLEINTANDSWSAIGANPGSWLKSIRTNHSAPPYSIGNYSAAIAFGGADTKGIITHAYGRPSVKFAGGNGSTASWKFSIYGGYNNETYDLNNFPTKTGGGASGTWGINITGNAKTATTANTATNASHASSANSATNADKVDGYHENSFLRYRGNAAANGEDTLWNQIGIKEYGGKLPKGVSGTYNYGAVVSLPAGGPRLDIWYNHTCSVNKDGLWYRSGYGTDQKAWARLLDSNNYTNWAPTKTGGGASGTWGINISGKANTAGTADTSKACSGNSATSTKLNSRGDQTAITAREEAGLYMHNVYHNGYPCNYGNVVTAGGYGGGQLLLGWSGVDKGIEHLYYRNRRDSTTSWSDWRTLAFTTDNVASATKLQTARTINGTSFNGTANITTASWGTARNISIADATATNTGSAVSVNGSGNVTLKLPATIKANLTGNVTGNVSGSSSSCTGNSATATKATQDSAGQQINTTYIKGLSISGNTITYTKGNGGTGTIAVPTGAGAKSYITESVVNSDGSWYRKWSDGWIEQGGRVSSTTNSGMLTVTLLKAFRNTNYTIITNLIYENVDWHMVNSVESITTTSFKWAKYSNASGGLSWYACGKGA